MMTKEFTNKIQAWTATSKRVEEAISRGYSADIAEAESGLCRWILRITQLEHETSVALERIDNVQNYYDCDTIRQSRNLVASAVDSVASLSVALALLSKDIARRRRDAELASLTHCGVMFRDGLIEWLRSAEKPLFAWDDYSSRPRGAYVELDAAGNIDAYHRTSHDISEHPDVVNRVDLWISVSPGVRGSALADFLEGDGRALLERVHCGRTIEHEGHQRRGVFTPDAESAIRQFTEALDRLHEL